MQAFIPDFGAGNVLLYRPNEKIAWEYMGIVKSKGGKDTIEQCPSEAAVPN